MQHGANVTPTTDRGAHIRSLNEQETEVLKVHVDYLQVTFPNTTATTVADLLGTWLPGDWAQAERGWLGYESQLVGFGGARVLSSVRRPEVHAVIPGVACSGLANEVMYDLLLGCANAGGKFTRVDLAGDDFVRVVEPLEVRAAIVHRDELVSHAHKVNLLEALRGDDGTTVYVGAPASRQRLRIYDKTAESGGAIDAVRWEIQAREQAAETLAAQLVAAGSVGNWGAVWAGRLVAVADFREPGAETEQRERVAWFRRLVGLAEKLGAYEPVPPRTLEQVRSWLIRQCAPSVATVITAVQGDTEFLFELVREGVARMGPRHRLLLNQAA